MHVIRTRAERNRIVAFREFGGNERIHGWNRVGEMVLRSSMSDLESSHTKQLDYRILNKFVTSSKVVTAIAVGDCVS